MNEDVQTRIPQIVLTHRFKEAQDVPARQEAMRFMAAETRSSSQVSARDDLVVQNAVEESSSAEDRFRRTAMWVLGCVLTGICLAVFYAFVRYGKTEDLWIPVAKQHFAAIVGLPMAALASLIIVLVLRVSAGPIEVEAWGLKFKGASAPIVFWILCFLAISTSIKMLW